MAEAPERCRLYLVIEDEEPDLGALECALDAADVACVLIRADAANSAAVSEIVALCQERDVAVLIEDDSDLAERLGADGVHASEESLWRDARDALGSGVIAGADATGSRHAAMTLAEAGADYVAFTDEDSDRLIDTVAWWSELFTSPCVASAGDDADLAISLAEAGADFVAAGPGLWRDAEALAALDEALARSREAA